MLNIAAFTGGKNVPSARFRVRQLIPYLANADVQIHEFVSPIAKYPPAAKWLRPFWGVGVLARRVPQIVAGRRYDMTLLQREFVSTLYTLEGFTRNPRILDVDDAIFLHRDGRFAEKLARSVDTIVCGNSFLAERFSSWNSRIEILPTAVDCERFVPYPRHNLSRPVIGWIGSRSNFRYLKQIEHSLALLLIKHPDTVFRVVADADPELTLLPSQQVEFIKWSPVNEAELTATFTIGIMPLTDGQWERGKCSFKMLQYMACAVPVVVSPVGMNAEVLGLGDVGLAAVSGDDWIDALDMLLREPNTAIAMGVAGREIVSAHFSATRIAERLADILRSVV